MVRAGGPLPEWDVVGFRVADTACAVPLAHVRQVVYPAPVAELPAAPEGVAGFADHRGHVLPVFDTFRLLGLAPGAPSSADRPKWILLDVGGVTIALVCDSVTGVIGIEKHGAWSSRGERRTGSARFIGHVTSRGGRPLLVLDIAAFAPLLREVGLSPRVTPNEVTS